MTKREEAIEEIRSAVSNMPYHPGEYLIDTPDGGEREKTLAEFLGNTWQSDYADELMRRASTIAFDAALAALREPDEAMKKAWVGPEPWDEDALTVWRAMLGVVAGKEG